MQPVNYIVFEEGHSSSNLSLHSVIVHVRVASFPDRDYEFTPFLLWPSSPFDPAAAATKYASGNTYPTLLKPEWRG